jgi:hypothetical protein
VLEPPRVNRATRPEDSSLCIARVRSPISTPSGTASNDVWNSSLFQTRTGTLREPNDPNVTNSATQVEIPIAATCPDARTVLSTTLEIVYSTGNNDDFGTPNDPSDDKPELEVFSVPVNLDCQGQRLTQNYFVKSDLSVVQWAMKTTEYHTPPDDYQPHCFNIGPTPVQALIPDLHGYFVNYNGGTDVLLTANGTKWLSAFFNLEGADPSEILRSSTMVSDANQNIASMSAMNPTLKSSALNPAKNVRVNYLYSLTQFKNRLRTKDITYFSGTLLTIAADGTVWGMGDDSYGQWSAFPRPVQRSDRTSTNSWTCRYCRGLWCRFLRDGAEFDR